MEQSQQQLQLQPSRRTDYEDIRVPFALFLRLQAQRAELLAAARHVTPQVTRLRAQICDWMRSSRIAVLDYSAPLHGEVRRVERKVTKRATVEDVFALIAHEFGDAVCTDLHEKLQARLAQRVEVRHDLRVKYKRGAEFARERHQAVLDEFVPNQSANVESDDVESVDVDARDANTPTWRERINALKRGDT
jgi:hypothetical protein